ncbi:hypothetical protein OG562_45545 [Streptomyces sp. NBC_01275]|uniref:hypothetical protein n=1 Tax=Streptomyces sp. NBC_01275 TaxID=2903807 RepID=UPI0022557528|nr:hypothetical protein [Streptomyces sp. NBC_01275]MCX4768062.1 hypothetical protein [Streptomyces sp. NBC_01275]
MPAARRRRIGASRGGRAPGPFGQAVLVLRWFCGRGCVHCLARGAGVSQAAGCRCLHEGVGILGGRVPDLHEAVGRCRREVMTQVILDGVLIESDRLAGVRDSGVGLWFGLKHEAFGGDVQFLAVPDGAPLRVSDVEPGSAPDVAAARVHALPVLCSAAADGVPTLADKGCIGAGIGIPVPSRLGGARRGSGGVRCRFCRSGEGARAPGRCAASAAGGVDGVTFAGERRSSLVVMGLMRVHRRRAGVLGRLCVDGRLDRGPQAAGRLHGGRRGGGPARAGVGRDASLPGRALHRRRGAGPDRGSAARDRFPVEAGGRFGPLVVSFPLMRRAKTAVGCVGQDGPRLRCV